MTLYCVTKKTVRHCFSELIHFYSSVTKHNGFWFFMAGLKLF